MFDLLVNALMARAEAIRMIAEPQRLPDFSGNREVRAILQERKEEEARVHRHA